jgi:protein-tyrosine phosphatase
MDNAGRVAAVVLAAGASSRFGGPKALARLWGRPMLQHALDVVRAADPAEIVVVLGRDGDEIEQTIEWRSERLVRNPNPDDGLSSSLRVGLGSLGAGREAALIFLGDQPTVREEVVARLLAGFVTEGRPIAVPSYASGGGPNPLLIHRTAWPLALEASGDRGLGPVLREHPNLVTEVQVAGSNPDVDTPEDLALLEASRPAAARPPMPAPIELGSLANFRAVGGFDTRDGRRVRTGILYRSGALDGLEPADAEALEHLGIRTIYDLRTRAEWDLRPDRVPRGARHVGLDVLDGLEHGTPTRIMALMSDPHAAREHLGDGKGAEMFLGQYRGFVALEAARRAYGRVFADLTDATCRPALIHCMGGKDRTGWAAAALLLLLDVPMSIVLADYLASNTFLGPGFKQFFDDFEARGGEPDLLAQFFWVRPDYLQVALDEVRRTYGTIERYFADGLGLGDDGVARLRETFLE